MQIKKPVNNIEEWRDIKRYQGLYQISNLGRVKRLKRKSSNGRILEEKILKNQVERKGYIGISLQIDGVKHREKIHRLIAEEFIPNPKNKAEVNHINGIKNDNRIENLEWVTPSENQKHAYKLGLRVVTGLQRKTSRETIKRARPFAYCKTRKRVNQYTKNEEYIRTWESIAEAIRKLGLRKGTSKISECCKGKIKTAYGYIWKYEQEVDISERKKAN